MMRYPIAIEIGDDETAYGVVVPDLPGCFSAGDTPDEAIAAAEAAAIAWIDATLDAGGNIPTPSSPEDVRRVEEFTNWSFGFVVAPPGRFPLSRE